MSRLIRVHVDVGQRRRADDVESSALHATTAERVTSIGAMERYTWVRFAGNLTDCHNAHSKGQHSSGAMDESSGQGQKASTRQKQCCHGYRSLQN